MARFLAIPSALFVLLSVHGVHAADCSGDTRQEHHVGNFNFVTSSWVEEVGNRRRYVSCVANLDPDSDLLVTWLIPGPYDSYVPDGEAALTPRLRDDLNPRPVDGCLKYANLGATTTAEFLGTEEDGARNNADNSCGQKSSAIQEKKTAAGGLPPEPYADDIRIFFPSDPSHPHDTMLEVTGKVGIKAEGGSYTSFFDYSARPYKDRPDGRLEDVMIAPSFGKDSPFLDAFMASNKPSYTLEKRATITFTVSGSADHKWQSVEGFYYFVNSKSGQVLSALPVPLLQDTGK
ncbi:hypothetical protein [Mesorhizobium sp.]|uniref:hypothetical protein n=1 Tax=Mesorhizobium sp. TaxID=1871066 RepID=UPI000FE640E8|nr:hypothetical protein [Mesorhizobium sp.]RWD70776.1 MAG: hypothetical protein EOS37_13605 [Mesorhizobium sp.]TIV55779.1 MAG: hypothetical protein E5V80_29260 [Mesorhizobium sp.]